MKETLPLAYTTAHTSRPKRPYFLLCILCLALGWLYCSSLKYTSLLSQTADDVCPQLAAYDPRAALGDKQIYRPSVKHSVQLLSEAVQIDTTVGDSWPDPDVEPDRWHKIFSPFASWLEKAYPHVHAKASPITREFVHRHGLLYTWQGSDESLKPLILMSHQDVVPVEQNTVNQWTHPPFSGYVDLDTQTVWGRGSVDCKLWLVSSLSSIESLLQSGFQPRRTVILSYGFDEESDGHQGASHLARFLEDRYGPQSIGMIVDEGLPVLSKMDSGSYGIPIATPSVDEKGAVNIKLVATSRGGHSSMPPSHTSIGILSRIIATLEAHPFPDLLAEASRPSIQQLQCTRDGPLMPRAVRNALAQLEWAEKLAQPSLASSLHQQMPSWQRLWEATYSHTSHQKRIEKARRRLIDALDDRTRNLLRTTQAVDLIHGGIKVNALPERTEAMINHRIAPYSSVNEVLSRYRTLLIPLAKSMSFSLTVEGEELVPATPTTLGHVTIDKHGLATDTHAASPFEGPRAAPFRLLSRVIRQTWRLDQPPVELHSLDEDAVPPPSSQWNESIRVSPATMYANTDTRWYHVRALFSPQNLTDHIFRFGAMSLHPFRTGESPFQHVHTVDEHVSIDSIVKATEFYTNLVVAVDYESLA